MLPTGVEVHRLQPHGDARGTFIELFRESWDVGVEPTQWNVVRSNANVLRGVHAHWRHADYLTVVAGRADIGLHDLREGSATEGLGAVVRLDADEPQGLTIPPGVAHGFYFSEASLHVYAVSHEWDPADELGCRWDDPELAIGWSYTSPLVSERDEGLGDLSSLRSAWQAAFATAEA